MSDQQNPQDDGTSNVFLKANAVMVEPGGAIFESIGEALASVKDARRKKQYLLHIGPGEYHEKVVMKPFVSLRGAGPGQTIITAPAEKEQHDAGTVQAASNCSLSGLTVISHGGSFGDNATAVNCVGVQQFMLANTELNVNDEGHAGVNLRAVAVDSLVSFEGPPSEVYITHCIITGTGQDSDSSGPTCLLIGGARKWDPADQQGATVDVHVSKIAAVGGRTATAAITNLYCKLNLSNTHVVGQKRCLVSGDMSGPITTTNCHLEGATSNVTDTNDPPPVYGDWGAIQSGGG